MTEHPISFERPGADPVDPRGALLHTPTQVPGTPTAALPAQARTGETPSTPGTAAPCGKGKEPASPPDTTGTGPEHSQPAAVEAVEPDMPRPRPGAEQDGPQGGGEGQERRRGHGLSSGQPTPMRRDGDLRRFGGAATRRLGRGLRRRSRYPTAAPLAPATRTRWEEPISAAGVPVLSDDYAPTDSSSACF